VPVYIFIILSAVAASQVIQWLFHKYAMYDRPELSTFLHWSVFAVAGFLMLLSIISNFRLVRRLLYKLY
jgi:hypothetical protein